MKKGEMTWIEMLVEAVSLVSAVIYLGLQIFYGISYGVSVMDIGVNILVMLLVYVGFTMLAIYPERVNGLSKGACSGDVRKYTLRMVRIEKLIFVEALLFTSICDVIGKSLPTGYTVGIILFMVAAALYYEYRIIRILRKRYKK